MNTDTLTNSAPDLAGHVKDLQNDARQVAQDLKQHAINRVENVRAEANTRLEDAKARVGNVYQSTRQFAVDHPFTSFIAGVAAGIIFASRARR